jgi:hypothetical protein
MPDPSKEALPFVAFATNEGLTTSADQVKAADSAAVTASVFRRAEHRRVEQGSAGRSVPTASAAGTVDGQETPVAAIDAMPLVLDGSG